MPKVRVNGALLYYEDTGAGPETVVFAHGLLWSSRLFDGQVEALKSRYRCITFDFRGQGQSEVTRSGYDMDSLTADVAALIETLKAAPCHFMGISMGGFVGMRLAARRPDLVRSLLLLGTSADAEPESNLSRYQFLAVIARLLGLRCVAGRIMPIFFGPAFLHDPARADEREHWRRQLLGNNRVGAYRAAQGVIRRQPAPAEIDRIRIPTLILVGEHDRATVPAKARALHERIPGSRLVIVPGVGHTANVEDRETVNKAIIDFLDLRGDLS